MPISKTPEGRWTLFCINGHTDPETSTMTRDPNPIVLVDVRRNLDGPVDLSCVQARAVLVFTCSVCGYVELYDAKTAL